MSSPKTTLGYPSRTAAVEALRAQGLTTSVIAARIGISPSSVTGLEASVRRRDARPEDARARSTQRQHSVGLDSDVVRALRPHAARRGLAVDALVRDLLAILTADNLVDALLDDTDDLEKAA